MTALNGVSAKVGRLLGHARTAPWPGILANRLRQATRPGRKIFVVGPNRCATTSLHRFFHRQGLKSIHWREGDFFVAKEIDARRDDPAALRDLLSKWTVFSDLVYLTDEVFIENHTLYETYLKAFPDALFLFNDRHVDNWIASRLRHADGTFITRYMNATGQTREEAVEAWRAGFLAHREAIMAFFAGRPEFLHFCIEKTDHPSSAHEGDISRLVAWLGDDYVLSGRSWNQRG